MTTTISLSRETKTDFDDARPPNVDSADEFVRMLLEAWDGPDPTDSDQAVELGDLREQLDRIESASTTAEERTGTIERKVDDLGGGRR